MLGCASMEFPRWEYWSGLPFPPTGGLPDPGMEPTTPVSPALQADSLTTESSGKPCNGLYWGLCHSLIRI